MQGVHERGAEDERLVLASRAGDESAFPALFDRWFDPCVDVAWRILHDRDAAADVAQETFLAAWRELDRLRQPSSFGGWVLRTARNRALNRLAGQRRSTVASDDDLTAALDGPASGAPADRQDETAAAVERAEGAELVWAASAALGERDASVLDLHLRHGFTAPEIAEALGVTANNAHQLLFRLKRKLGGAIQAWVLWPAASRPGVAGCPGLRQAIDDAGVTRFGPEAVRVIDRHAQDCDACQDRRQLRVAPEVLFGAVPIVPAGSILRARAAAALQADGVPMPASGPSSEPDPHSSGPADSLGSPGSPGGGSAGDGQAEDGEDGAPPRARRGRRTRIAAGALIVAIVVAGLAMAASGGGSSDDEQVATAADDEASSTSDASTTTVPATTSTTGGAATTAADAGTTVATDPPPGPPGDESEDPGTTPDPVGDPGPGGGSTDPDPDPEPPDPQPEPEPEISRFTAVAGQIGGRPCRSAERPITLTWASTGADSASLAGPGAPGGAQPASGQATACLDPGSPSATYTLTATGPGGRATATASAGTPAPP
jgi:RNA polymerase sigma factor (sigma-70 family)